MRISGVDSGGGLMPVYPQRNRAITHLSVSMQKRRRQLGISVELFATCC